MSTPKPTPTCDLSLETSPGTAQGPHWSLSVQLLGTPREVAAGEVLTLVPSKSGSGFELSEASNASAAAFHFPMVHDRDRNDAYNQVKPL